MLFRSGPDNCGVVSWQEGESWQLTVYEPSFQTPDSIKGKVFYQIFPDRFCEGVENKVSFGKVVAYSPRGSLSHKRICLLYSVVKELWRKRVAFM